MVSREKIGHLLDLVFAYSEKFKFDSSFVFYASLNLYLFVCLFDYVFVLFVNLTRHVLPLAKSNQYSLPLNILHFIYPHLLDISTRAASLRL